MQRPRDYRGLVRCRKARAPLAESGPLEHRKQGDWRNQLLRLGKLDQPRRWQQRGHPMREWELPKSPGWQRCRQNGPGGRRQRGR